MCWVFPTDFISIDLPAYGSEPGLGYECIVASESWSQVNANDSSSNTTLLPTPKPCCPTVTIISPVNAL